MNPKQIETVLDSQNPITSDAQETLPGSPTPQTPNLAFSKDNTPYLDEQDDQAPTPEAMDAISDGSSSADEEVNVNTANLEKAYLKRPSSAPLRKDPIKQRKSTVKAIEKLWVPLDRETIKSFNELSSIATEKILTTLNNSSNRQGKILETQRVLSCHWTSESQPKSFCARLKVTKLPLLKSLPIRTRDLLDPVSRALDTAVVQQRKELLEAKLLAEKKELETLETYYKSVSATLELDQEYLSEFTKYTQDITAQLDTDTKENRNLFGLDETSPTLDRFQQHHQANGLFNLTDQLKRFHPEKDTQVRGLLAKFESTLSAIDPSFTKFQGYMDFINVKDGSLNDRDQFT